MEHRVLKGRTAYQFDVLLFSNISRHGLSKYIHRLLNIYLDFLWTFSVCIAFALSAISVELGVGFM